MPKLFTLEELREWTPKKRLDLYLNAKKRPDGQYIVDLIDQNGLSLSAEALTMDDPVYLTIVDTVWSNEGRSAAQAAVKAGIPSVCAVDLLLQEKLGDRYGKYDLGTATAGSIVAELMRHLGYKEAGQGVCPSGCTAKTGMRWQ